MPSPYRKSSVLDLLHALRMSFSVLRTCQCHLFAIRTISLRSCRPSANPLVLLKWLRHLELSYPYGVCTTAPRIKRNRSHSHRKLNCGSRSCFATHFRIRFRWVVLHLSQLRCSFLCSAWKMPIGRPRCASARIKRHRFKIKIKSVVLIYNFSTFTHFVCSCFPNYSAGRRSVVLLHVTSSAIASLYRKFGSARLVELLKGYSPMEFSYPYNAILFLQKDMPIGRLYRIIRVRIALFSLLNPNGFSRSIVLFTLTG